MLPPLARPSVLLELAILLVAIPVLCLLLIAWIFGSILEQFNL